MKPIAELGISQGLVETVHPHERDYFTSDEKLRIRNDFSSLFESLVPAFHAGFISEKITLVDGTQCKFWPLWKYNPHIRQFTEERGPNQYWVQIKVDGTSRPLDELASIISPEAVQYQNPEEREGYREFVLVPIGNYAEVITKIIENGKRLAEIDHCANSKSI